MEVLTSGENNIEEYDIQEESNEDSLLDDGVADEELEEPEGLYLMTKEDLPLVEYGAVGAIACGSGLIISLGVLGILSLLRKG